MSTTETTSPSRFDGVTDWEAAFERMFGVCAFHANGTDEFVTNVANVWESMRSPEAPASVQAQAPAWQMFVAAKFRGEA